MVVPNLITPKFLARAVYLLQPDIADPHASGDVAEYQFAIADLTAWEIATEILQVWDQAVMELAVFSSFITSDPGAKLSGNDVVDGRLHHRRMLYRNNGWGVAVHWVADRILQPDRSVDDHERRRNDPCVAQFGTREIGEVTHRLSAPKIFAGYFGNHRAFQPETPDTEPIEDTLHHRRDMNTATLHILTFEQIRQEFGEPGDDRTDALIIFGGARAGLHPQGVLIEETIGRR